ncbi:Pkinase-domain-containing protein [Dacryopinax primogenitus]|uniref:non-specific serine/threonine protein kinase n=1 Tax=Dacryopinax primogenitus (strain DJM 731) TaxID=1858805 RepID=M5FUK7_DACPD|nr:Pkinase-domain-containing protein [Dacryopinax primogenitus]EJU01441.1 Pkinase-domain-containing protein [Dacryopinax primogenitus]
MAPVPSEAAAENCLPYIRDAEVGSGTFANVFKGHHVETNKVVAIKMIPRKRLYNAKLEANALREAEILRKIHHPRITSLIELQEKEWNIFLIMEFCSGGDLHEYKRKRGKIKGLEYMPDFGMMPVYYPHPPKGGLATFAVRSFLVQLIDVMKFMHQHSMVHRDLKPSNIMLTLPGERELMNGHPLGIPVLKVADFGFARILPGKTLAETLCGSPLYMAPEVYLENYKYDSKADLWSLGCILFELAYGELPYLAQTITALQAAHKVSDGSTLLDKADTRAVQAVPRDVRDLCAILLQGDVEKRASHRMVFAHEAVRISQAEALIPPERRQKNIQLMQKLAEISAPAYEALSLRYRPTKRPEGVMVEVEPKQEKREKKEREREKGVSQEEDKKVKREARPVVPIAPIVPTRPAPAPPVAKIKTPKATASGAARSPSEGKSRPPTRKELDPRRLDSQELEREFVIVEEAPAVAINQVADEMQRARELAKDGPDPVDQRGGYKSWDLPDLQVDGGAVNGQDGNGRKKPNYIFDPKNAGEEQMRHRRNEDRRDHHFPPSPNDTVVAPTPMRPIPPAEKPRSTSALSKAIQAASLKLFGTPLPNRPDSSPPLRNQHIIPVGASIPPEEKDILRRLEDISQKTHVLNEFANSRRDVAVVPHCKVHDHHPVLGEAYFPANAGDRQLASWQCGRSEEEILQVLNTASEAVELYMRVMMFSQKALDWTIDFSREKELRQDSTPPSGTFNGAVQWFRHVFNRARKRCNEMRGVAGDHIIEKVDLFIYNKALELARDGGLKETQPELWLLAEEEYTTALLLLSALFDDVFQADNPERDKDRITLDIYINLIKVRIGKIRRNMADAQSVPTPAATPGTSPEQLRTIPSRGSSETSHKGSPLVVAS